MPKPSSVRAVGGEMSQLAGEDMYEHSAVRFLTVLVLCLLCWPRFLVWHLASRPVRNACQPWVPLILDRSRRRFSAPRVHIASEEPWTSHHGCKTRGRLRIPEVPQAAPLVNRVLHVRRETRE